jgi:hypothetical protein
MLFIDADAPRSEQATSLLATSGADDRHLLPDILALRYLFPPTDDYVQTVLQADLTRRGPDGKLLPTDDDDVLTAAQKLQLVALLPPQELPTEWLNYTCLDLIFISLADARALSRNRPEPWAAMIKHVRAGGNLIVSGVGDGFATLSELDELLAVSVDSDQEPRKATGGAAAAGQWRALDESRFGSSLASLGSPGQVVRDYSGNVVTVEEIEAGLDGNPDLDGDGDVDEDDEVLRQQRVDAEKQKEKPLPDSELFRVRSLGWGRVVALAPEELADASGYQWAWALNDLGPDRWRWYRRHGLSCQRSNPTFWDFLIPGVGAAPVRTFLAVITGFMIVIGPVNYFFLSRSRRLYLLLITVPLGSAIIIGSLFGFAVLKDGLGTRARLRSFSQIMPDGQVTSWSRQSYYAGLAPSSGLVYPRDAAVFPIEFDARRDSWKRQLIRWSNVQQFASGYLAARSTAQNLVIHSGRLEAFVELQRHGAEPPLVTNRSSIHIDQLLIQDKDESFWLSNLAPGAMVPAQPLTRFDAQERYTQLLRDHRPATPVGFTAPSDRGSYRYYYNNVDASLAAPDFQSSLMEDAIGAPLTTKGAVGRVYYAVTEQTPPSVPMGVRNCREVSGFHVIHGSW